MSGFQGLVVTSTQKRQRVNWEDMVGECCRASGLGKCISFGELVLHGFFGVLLLAEGFQGLEAGGHRCNDSSKT